MLESKDMSLAFEGQSSGEEVSVTLPPLDHVLKEGTYDMTLEVVVDDRFFEPLKLQGAFEKRLKVTAESVTVRTKPKVKTSASLVEVKKKGNQAKINVTNKVNKKPIKESRSKNKEFTDADIMNIIKQLTRNKK